MQFSNPDHFLKTGLASGSFIEGEFVKMLVNPQSSPLMLKLPERLEMLLNIPDGILLFKPMEHQKCLTMKEKAPNLITFQGDLNYDGRVSMKDLAYLNAGAASNN